jgi:hypothetical protein
MDVQVGEVAGAALLYVAEHGGALAQDRTTRTVTLVTSRGTAGRGR